MTKEGLALMARYIVTALLIATLAGCGVFPWCRALPDETLINGATLPILKDVDGLKLEAITATSDGGCCLVGWAGNPISGASCVVRLDAAGRATWRTSLCTDDGWASDIRLLSDGNFAVTETAENQQVRLIVVSGAGSICSRKPVSMAAGAFEAGPVQECPDGRLMVIKWSTSSVAVETLTSSGEALSVTTTNLEPSSYVGDAIATADGGFMLVHGRVTGFPDLQPLLHERNFDCAAIKFDRNAKISWRKRYWSAGAEGPSRVIQTTDGEYVMIAEGEGWAPGSIPAFYRLITLRSLDANGDMVWERSYYNGIGDYCVQSACDAGDGSFFLAGENVADSTNAYLFLAKFDSSLRALWVKGYSDQQASCYSFLADPSNGALRLAGNLYLTEAHTYSPYLLGIDANGNPR